MNREKAGRVAFGVLLVFYCIDVLLPAIGTTWFARTEAHLFWVGSLLFYFPMVTALAGMALIYAKQKLSWWTVPLLIYATVPAAFMVTMLIRSGALVTIQEGARNTQGFAAGALLSILLVFANIFFPLFIGGPIALATLVWAEKEWKKLVAIPVISFVVLTITFFLLLTDRA